MEIITSLREAIPPPSKIPLDPTSIRFFMLPPQQPFPDEAVNAAASPETAPISLKAEAESVIPLIDPEETPQLTFAADSESDDADPEETAGKPQANALALLAREIAPAPLEYDAAGLERVPVSREMAARIEERLSLYADPDAAAEDRTALPQVFKACYALAGDEPLARELHAAGVSHGRLFGAGLYLFVLRDMLAGNAGDAARRDRLEREAAAMERLMADEFRRSYLDACVRFLPEHERMPAAVRAFLRHGMVGMKGWWLRREVRDFILRDCRDHTPLSVRFDSMGAVVLYADEYLAAVAEMECAPTPNPKLENLEWLTVDRLADRCYRRIVNAGSYTIRLKGLITEMEDRLRAIEDGKPGGGQARDRQVLQHQLERIRNEIMDSILEAVQQAEGRFRRGELRMPNQEDLIRGETTAFLGMGPGMSDGERVFMPLALRERFPVPSDAINDRESLRAAVARLEARQPDVFSRVLNPHDRHDEQLRLRLPPLFVIYPTSGVCCHCGLESRGMDGGHIFVPLCYSSRGVGDANLAAVLVEYTRRGESVSTA
jgi:hypothetical protein